MISIKCENELEWSKFKKKYPSFSTQSKFKETFIEDKNRFSFGYFYSFSDEKKNLILKRFIINSSEILFLRYLKIISNFQNVEKLSYRTNYILSIKNFSQNPKNNQIYVIHSLKKNCLSEQKEYLSELEIICIIRNIVSLYSHLLYEKELVELMLHFRICPISTSSIWYYRKFWNEIEKKLPKYKIKLDLLAIKCCEDEPSQEIEANYCNRFKKFHLPDLYLLIKYFPITNWGVNIRCFLNRLKNCKEIDWSLVLSNPFFLESKKVKVNWEFWRITENDRMFNKIEKKIKMVSKPSKQKALINFNSSEEEKEFNKNKKEIYLEKIKDNYDEKEKMNKIEIFIEFKNSCKNRKIDKELNEIIISYMKSNLDYVDLISLKEQNSRANHKKIDNEKIENVILDSGIITKEKLKFFFNKNKNDL